MKESQMKKRAYEIIDSLFTASGVCQSSEISLRRDWRLVFPGAQPGLLLGRTFFAHALR